MLLKCGTEGMVRERTFPIGMDDCAIGMVDQTCILQRLFAQLRLHVVVPVEPMDTAVEAVQHCRQAKILVPIADFCDACERFLVWA